MPIEVQFEVRRGKRVATCTVKSNTSADAASTVRMLYPAHSIKVLSLTETAPAPQSNTNQPWPGQEELTMADKPPIDSNIPTAVEIVTLSRERIAELDSLLVGEGVLRLKERDRVDLGLALMELKRWRKSLGGGA